MKNVIMVNSGAIESIAIIRELNSIIVLFKNYDKKYVYSVSEEKYIDIILNFIQDVEKFKSGIVTIDYFDKYEYEFGCDSEKYIKEGVPSFGRLHHNLKNDLNILIEVTNENEIIKTLKEFENEW